MKENRIAGFFKGVGNTFGFIGTVFIKGDWKTKLSFIIMGFGSLMRKQFARGIAFLAVEVLYIWYIVSFGAGYIKDLILRILKYDKKIKSILS